VIPDEDLIIERWPDRQVGGQHAGTRNGIKITHVPSGLVACCDIERSQFRNKKISMDMITGGLTSSYFRY
jgi:protein subunit release factor A